VHSPVAKIQLDSTTQQVETCSSTLIHSYEWPVQEAYEKGLYMRSRGSRFAWFLLTICFMSFVTLAQAKSNTTTKLTSAPNPSLYEQAVTFTARVAPVSGHGTPTGIVTLRDGANSKQARLSGGTAVFKISNLTVGSYSFTATYSGDSNYNGSKSSVLHQTVNRATPTITWPQPAPITYGTPLSGTQLDATANVPGTFVYNPAAGTILTAGTQTLSVTFTPTDTTDYYTANDSVPLTVNQAVPTITWPQPAPITAQAPLSGLQLDATANVPGTFVYNPAAGTILTQGTQTLNVTFTPTDSTDYTNQKASVVITVFATNTFIVAPDGNDTWSGYLSTPNSPTNPTDGPLASPGGAQAKIRALTGSSRSVAISVFLRAGTYYLALSQTAPGTLIFNQSGDNGTASAGITWEAYPNDATPVISGGVPANLDGGVGLNVTWQVQNGTGNWYYANLPTTLPNTSILLEPFESLYYNGERRLRSRIHDSGTTGSSTSTLSVGYYMQSSNSCAAIGGWPAGEFTTSLESCNLGSFLRVTATIAPTDPNGTGCPTDETNQKCLDRFYYTQSVGTYADPIQNWSNLTSTTAVPNQPCTASTSYPQGDVELIQFDAWTVDVMRINCVDSTQHIIYLAGPTKNGGSAGNYKFFGPQLNHRFIVENSYDAFVTAQSAGQTGIWFLDRRTTSWVLNYIANANENPGTANITIPQLPQTGSQFLTGGQFPLFSSQEVALNDYTGGSLISATGLSYVTFTGIDFEVDNFYPAYATATNNYTGGFNNDVNGEMSVPQAIDCENCNAVTFNGVAVRHTSASGILAAAVTTSALPCDTGAPPTATSNCVLIENSSFYDIGDSGIRIGHYPQPTDKSKTVVQDVYVQNNLVQGFSRVLADGEGIAAANGFNNEILSNTVTDGYHAGISICVDGCGRASNDPNPDGNNILVNNNLIYNLMQGITSDGGSIYFNVGSAASATGDQIKGNVVHDTTDSYIIDYSPLLPSNPGTGYGGEGIFLDKQTANVDVENNLVYNVDGHGVHLTQGVAVAGTYNTFKNNIFAFANEGIFTQQSPWFANGCPSSPIQQVQMLDNLLVFDINIDSPQTGRPAYATYSGCTNSCTASGGSYSEYQLFEGNDWFSTTQTFSSVSDAFKIQADQTGDANGISGTRGAYMCTGYSPVSLYFSQTSNNWQTGSNPISMMEDAAGASADPRTTNPSFPSNGYSTIVKQNFTISSASGLGQFNPNGSDGMSGTNGAISNAGSTLPALTTTCSTVPAASVCPTFPTYVYGSTTLPF
jgi:hypothetical protein